MKSHQTFEVVHFFCVTSKHTTHLLKSCAFWLCGGLMSPILNLMPRFMKASLLKVPTDKNRWHDGMEKVEEEKAAG